MAVTSYGRNKNHDEIKKTTKRRPIIAPAIAVRLLKKIIIQKENIQHAISSKVQQVLRLSKFSVEKKFEKIITK